MKTKVKDYLERDGIIERIGENRIYDYIYEAAVDQTPNSPVLGTNSD